MRQRDAWQDQGSGEKSRGLFFVLFSRAGIFEAVMMGYGMNRGSGAWMPPPSVCAL